MTDYLFPRLVDDRYDDGFAVRLQLKDHRLFGAMARELGLASPVNDLATAAYTEALPADADRDVTAVVQRAISRARRSAGRDRPA